MGHYDDSYEYDDEQQRFTKSAKYTKLAGTADDVFDKLDKIVAKMSPDTDRELIEAETRKLRALYYFCLSQR